MPRRSLAAIVLPVTVEQRLLAISILLGLVNDIAASHLISAQYGYAWTASTREKEMPPLTGVAARVDAAFTNFIETFPFFAAAIFDEPRGVSGLCCGRLGLLRSLIWNVATIGG